MAAELGDLAQELQPLGVGMALLALANDLAIEHVQRGEQRGRAVALVVVRQRLCAPLLQRQPGLRAVQRLHLALLVTAQHQRVLGRRQVQAHDVFELLDELGVARDLSAASVSRHWRKNGLKPHLVRGDRQTPNGKTLHLIADNYATHKHPTVQEWLTTHPRFNMHFTPTSASWLNMVERFFRDITVNRLRRGVFTSVPELVSAIDEYVAHHNTKPKPFIWTKSAADILQKVIRANSRLSSKQNATLH
jgi:transposase